MSKDSLRDRLQSLEAYLQADSGDAEASLAKLAGLTDPESIRRRLLLLLKLKRRHEAAELAGRWDPSHEWLEAGVRAAVLDDNAVLAAKLMDAASSLADTSQSLPLRCATSYADAALIRHWDSRHDQRPVVSTYAVEPSNREWLERGLAHLERSTTGVRERASSAKPLERDALTVLVLVMALLGRGRDTDHLIAVVIKSVPVHVELGRYAVDGRIPPSLALADALERDHASDFVAMLFVNMIRSHLGSNKQRTFTAMAALRGHAKTSNDKEILFAALLDAALSGDESLRADLEDLRVGLLDESLPSHQTLIADMELRLGKPEAAASRLDALSEKDDPRWSVVRAQCDFAMNRVDEGLVLFQKVALAYLSDEWLQECANRLYRKGKISAAVTCLERVREYYPWLTQARRNLAVMLWDAERLEESRSELEYLSGLLSTDVALHLQLARTYMRLHLPAKCIEVLTPLCRGEAPDIQAVLMLASALRGVGCATDAFALLQQHRTTMWDRREFVFMYMDVASASGHEEAFGEALVKLQELSKKGELDPRTFRMASLDELVDLGRKNHERHDKLRDAIVHGRLPWTVSAETTRRPLLIEWMIRTQPMKWLSEDVTSRADYSIYATNGFALNAGASDRKDLLAISASESGVAVCVDYSALVTIHFLGLIPTLFKTYKEVYLPSAYRASVLGDSLRLQPHQLSHKKGYETIRSSIDSGAMSVTATANPDGIPLVDEYADAASGSEPHRLAWIVECVSRQNLLNAQQQEALRKLATRSEAEGSEAVQRGAPLLINLQTLMSLYREGLFEPLLTSFRLYISDADHRELVQDVRQFEFQQQALEALGILWTSVSSGGTVKFVPPQVLETSEDDEVEDHGLALAAIQLAQARGLPLLADDRALQSVVTNGRGSAKGTAFGTVDFLRVAWKTERLTLDQYASSVLKLMQWRYRFVVPRAEVLLSVAKRYEGLAPGSDLVDVARYMHDCMADPGLFGGLEPSTPPISMAVKTYMALHGEIGHFLAMLWLDSDVSDERAMALTEWTARAMFPSTPVALREDFHSRMAAQMRESPVLHALLRLSTHPPSERVPKCLEALRARLGISRRRFERMVGELAQFDHGDLNAPLRSQMALNCLRQAFGSGPDTVPWHVATLLADSGLFSFDEATDFPAHEYIALIEQIVANQTFQPSHLIFMEVHAATDDAPAEILEIVELLSVRHVAFSSFFAPLFVRILHQMPLDVSSLGVADAYLKAVQTGEAKNIAVASASLDVALRDDWAWQVATLRAACDREFTEKINRQLRRLVNYDPTVGDRLNTVHAAFRENQAALETTSASNQTTQDVVERIRDIAPYVGHLPWRADLGVGAVLTERPEDEIAKQRVWSAVESEVLSRGPAWWVHAWLVAVAHPDYVPSGSWNTLWSRIAALVLNRDQSVDPLDLAAARYHQLFKVFAYRIESGLPTAHSDFVFWWASRLASDVAQCLESDKLDRDGVRDFLATASAQAEQVWQVAAAPFADTSIRAAFVAHRSYWPSVIQASLPLWKENREKVHLTSEGMEALVKVIRETAVRLGSPNEATDSSLSSLIIRDLSTLHLEWGEVANDEITSSLLAEYPKYQAELGDPSTVANKVKDPIDGERDQFIVFWRWSDLVRSGRISFEDALATVNDQTWLERVEPGLSMDSLDMVMSGLLHAPWVGDNSVRVKIAHWCARQVHVHAANEQRRKVYEIGTALTSLKGSTSSAITRLVSDDVGNRFAGERRELRSTMGRLMDRAPAWLQGRLRRVWVSLDE